jgi:hypothetical protein
VIMISISQDVGLDLQVDRCFTAWLKVLAWSLGSTKLVRCVSTFLHHNSAHRQVLPLLPEFFVIFSGVCADWRLDTRNPQFILIYGTGEG